MDMILRADEPAPIEAASYALVLAHIACWSCRAMTPTAFLWVPAYLETYEDETRQEDDAALLHYVQRLNIETLTHLQRVAPYLRLARTQTAGFAYLAHHCQTCAAVQGDRYLLAPDGPYWPENDATLSDLEIVAGKGALRADASTSQSSWMDSIRITLQATSHGVR